MSEIGNTVSVPQHDVSHHWSKNSGGCSAGVEQYWYNGTDPGHSLV